MSSEPIDFGIPSHGARYMLARGFKILPIKPNDKIPAVSGWQEWSKTADEGTLSSSYEERNWAIHPGLTGHFVVDIDNKGGKTGSDTWAAMQRQYGDVPRTFTVETPSGGLHLYFKGKVTGVNTIIGKDVDTRAMDGYVLAPGSEIDGKRYVIIDSGEVAEAPQWLVDLIVPKAAAVIDRPVITALDLLKNIDRTIEYLQDAPICVQGENGDAGLYKVFCNVRDFGISQEKARELVWEHFNPRCDPPWEEGDEHFDKKLENAYRYGQNSLGAKTDEAAVAGAIEDFKDAPLPESTIKSETEDPAWLVRVHDFDVNEEFPEDDYFIFVGEDGIIETGDIAVIQAKTKSGKSAVIGAMMAAMFVDEDKGQDFLGFKGANKKRDYVLHFDTEQKPKDHQALLKRSLARAGLAKQPDWFHSKNIKALTRRERAACVEHYLRHFSKLGRVKAVFIDGIGDLCEDTNDKEKSENLGERITRWALAFRCAVVTVLHENPSKESEKMRGHLGTYLEMKAETVIRLEKSAKGVSTVWSERMRRGHIPKGDGPSFVWNKERKMHVSCMGAKEVEELEANLAFGNQKAECEEFLNRHLPEGQMLASELNVKAVAESRTFAAHGRADRFVDKISPLLADSSIFKLCQQPNGKRAYFVERRQDFSFLN